MRLSVSGARYRQRLSAREREVLGALCAGERRAEIAQRLYISIKTVDKHTENIKIKLGARTTAAATYEYAVRYRSAI